MTTLSQTQTTDRRGFLRLVLVGGAGYVVVRTANVFGQALELETEQATAVPQVKTDNPHAMLKHGLQDVLTVRTAMMDMAAREPAWFDRPPCSDGRYRLVLSIGERFGVWVLEKSGAMYKEVTAFLTNQDYAKKVNEDCGNGPWLGFAAIWEGQDGQKGEDYTG